MYCPQCLYSNGGYTYLDVRSQLEVEEVGKVKDAVNIPFMLVSRKYDPETRERKMVKEPNPDFVRQVRQKRLKVNQTRFLRQGK